MVINIGAEDPIEDKVRMNIGGLVDVPTATIIVGAKGEYILNDGLPKIKGIVEPGNNFKTVVAEDQHLCVLERVLLSNLSTFINETGLKDGTYRHLCQGQRLRL